MFTSETRQTVLLPPTRPSASVSVWFDRTGTAHHYERSPVNPSVDQTGTFRKDATTASGIQKVQTDRPNMLPQHIGHRVS